MNLTHPYFSPRLIYSGSELFLGIEGRKKCEGWAVVSVHFLGWKVGIEFHWTTPEQLVHQTEATTNKLVPSLTNIDVEPC